MEQLPEILTSILAIVAVLCGGKMALLFKKLKQVKNLIIDIDVAWDDKEISPEEMRGIVEKVKLLLGITPKMGAK